VTKFVGKFRNDEDYNDEYNFLVRKKKRNEMREHKKTKNRYYDEYELDRSKLPKKSKHI
jgi:hypothetical protein